MRLQVTIPDSDKATIHIPMSATWFAWSYPCGDWEKLAADEAEPTAADAKGFLGTGGLCALPPLQPLSCRPAASPHLAGLE